MKSGINVRMAGRMNRDHALLIGRFIIKKEVLFMDLLFSTITKWMETESSATTNLNQRNIKSVGICLDPRREREKSF